MLVNGCGMEQVIARVMETLDESEDTDRQTRRVEQESRREVVAERIDSMREAADLRFVSSIVSGVNQIASGIRAGASAVDRFDAGGAEAQAAEAARDAEFLTEQNDASLEPAIDRAEEMSREYATESRELTATAAGRDAGSEVQGGASKIACAALDRAATEADARGAELQEIAQQHDDLAQEAQSDAERAQRLHDRAMDHLAQIAEGRVQAQLAATRA